MIQGTVCSLLAGTVAVFLSLMFAKSVCSKMADIDAFSAAIDAYQLIPTAASRIVAYGFIAAEVLLVVGLLVPRSRAVGALVALTLLLVYATAMTINLSRGRSSIDCGCGGLPQPISHALVMRNVLLAALAMPLWTVSSTSPALQEAIVAGVSGVTLWLGWPLAEQLESNFAHFRRQRKGQP